MKLVTAFIQPHALNDVKQELYKNNIFKMSVTNTLGCGQQMGYHESYRGVDIEVNLLKKLRLDIAVNEEFVKPTVDAIIEGARSGEIGDGKIFVTAIEECIRIRNGESGKIAIG
jgi:nitrogen regulatory protein P-II 1